jgi:hypothetical protein
MIRITLVEIALVATPFLLFFLYRALVSARRAEGGEAINETPYQILFLSGSVIALASLVAVVLLGRDDEDGGRDQVFIPPHVVDGEVIPGRLLSRDEAIAEGIIEGGASDQDFDPDTPNGGADEPGAESPDARAP